MQKVDSQGAWAEGGREGSRTGGVQPTEGRVVRAAEQVVCREGEVGGAERVVVLAAAMLM
eukprot:COSAG01_NODE_19186_length_1025_cov_1.240821_1_plen_59_part_10